MMRTFVHYDKNGQILSVAQVERLVEGLAHPFVMSNKGEGVLELGADDPAARLEPHDLHDGYIVEVSKKRLKKKTS